MIQHHKFVLLHLLTGCLRVLSSICEEPSDGRCLPNCSPPRRLQGKIYSKCTFSDHAKGNGCNKGFLNQQQNASFLDLSGNNLKEVPSWLFCFYKSLRTLSLAQNNIKTIKPGTFQELRNLKAINLSLNDVRDWKMSLGNELTSLNYLDVTGNEHWLPSKELLQRTNLTTVQGISWTEHCIPCSLVKIKPTAAGVNSTSQWACENEYLSSPRKWRRHGQIQYGHALEFIKLGYWPTCLCKDVCYTHQFNLPHFQAHSKINVRASFFLYAAASVALLVNTMVFVIILFTKSLGRDSAICLILNVTLCDVLVSVGSLLYASYHPDKMWIELIHHLTEEKVKNRMKGLRNIVGPFLTCAVASHVFGSLILTMEKFLKIVFFSKPNVRIGMRNAPLYLLLSWCLSASFAILPAFEVGRMTYNAFVYNTPLPSDMLVTDSDGKLKGLIGIATGSQIVLIFIQLTSFVLYLPIFVVARRSGANVGIKREATIAKKIALLVFSNLIFFTIPVIIGIFQVKIWVQFGQPMKDDWQDYTLETYQWFVFTLNTFPALCLSINGVLNPFLYSIRHPKIKQQIDSIMSRCRTILSGCLGFVIQHVRCHSNVVQQGDYPGMQEMNQIKYPQNSNWNNE